MAAASTATLPPGPRIPRALQTAGFLFFNTRWVDGNRRRYGDVVTFSTLFDSRFVMVFEPEALKQVFRGSPQHLRAGEANALLGPVVGERSVLLLDGDEHLRQRKLMLPAFHGERMKAYEQVMRDATDRAIDEWPVGEPFALQPSMQSLTLDVIMRAVFGTEAGPRERELKQGLRNMINPIGNRLGFLLSLLTDGRIGSAQREVIEKRERVDRLIYDEIARRREADDLDQREDVLSMLILARDENGEPMTDAELRDELVTLLVAGHETTATGLAWAFELLLHDPARLERLRSSLAEGDPTYADAVVKETLRIRPVIAGVGRVVREQPCEVGGYTIPPGVEINPSIAGIHRRADRYPAPNEFRPERFLGDDAPDTYTWVPFGGGTRRCLGASFALFEMRIVIARALERADLRTASDKPEPGVRRGITFVPKQGARVVLSSPPRPASAQTGQSAGVSAAA